MNCNIPILKQYRHKVIGGGREKERLACRAHDSFRLYIMLKLRSELRNMLCDDECCIIIWWHCRENDFL